MDRDYQSILYRWSIVISIAIAIFAGMCNVMSLILDIYVDIYLRHHPWSPEFIPPMTIALAPLLVLFALRRFLPVVLPYALMLLQILVEEIDYLRQYSGPYSPPLRKLDGPGVALLFLGIASIAVFLAWAIIRFLFSRGER